MTVLAPVYDGIRIYEGATGRRRQVAESQLGAASWSIIPTGGYDDFTVPIAAEYAGLPAVIIGDRVEVWARGLLQYRGYVTERGLLHDSPIVRGLKGYGRSQQIGGLTCDYPLVFSTPVDLSEAVRAVFESFVRPYLPATNPLTTDFDVIGLTVTAVDTLNKTVMEVLNALTEMAGGTAIWGCDVDDEGFDRLFLRLIDGVAPPTFSEAVPGIRVGRSEGRQQGADIVNRLRLMAGAPKWPNLLTNPSFERLAEQGDQISNIVLNSSFESFTLTDIGGGTFVNIQDDWDLDAGAAWKQGSEGGTNPATGRYRVETDNDTETVTQIRTGIGSLLPEGNVFRLAVMAAPESEGASAVGQIRIWWYVGGVEEPTEAASRPVVTAQAGWAAYDVLTAPVPSGADGYRIEISKISGPNGANKGIHWDDVTLHDMDAIFQQGWRFALFGSAAIPTIEWARRDGTAKHGGYYVRLTVEADDTDGQDAHLEPLDFMPIQGGQTIRFSGWLRTPPGGTEGKLLTEIHWYKADRSSTGTVYKPAISPGAPFTDWVYFEAFAVAPSDAAFVHCYITFREDADWDIDALMVCDNSEDGPRDGDDAPLYYYPDGPLSLTILAGDVITEMEDSAVHHSGDDPPDGYGTRDGFAQVDGVATVNQAIAFARLYFPLHAVPVDMPAVTLLGSDRALWPGQTLRLTGAGGALISGGKVLPIVPIRGEWDTQTGLSHSMDLNRPQPTLSALMLLVARDQRRASAGSTGGSLAVGSGTGSSSGTIVAGASGPAGGDLDGTYPDPDVVKLQGNPVDPAAPSTGDVLQWDGSAWAPSAPRKLRWQVQLMAALTPTGTGIDTAFAEAPYGPGNASVTWVPIRLFFYRSGPVAGSDTLQIRKSSAGNAAFGSGTTVLSSSLTLSGGTTYRTILSSGGDFSTTIASGNYVAVDVVAIAGTGWSVILECEEQ